LRWVASTEASAPICTQGRIGPAETDAMFVEHRRRASTHSMVNLLISIGVVPRNSSWHGLCSTDGKPLQCDMSDDGEYGTGGHSPVRRSDAPPTKCPSSGFKEVHMEMQIDVRVAPATPWSTFLACSPHPWAPTAETILRESFTAGLRVSVAEKQQTWLMANDARDLRSRYCPSGIRRG
jgi:hypothetical protein